MNKNLPPLTDILPIGSEAGMEFERLMKKLLIHDGSLKGYEFEPGATHYDRGIDGYVRAKYPGADSPVVFQFKWLRGNINSGSNAQQIKNSIHRFLAGDSKAASYILVTPNDLKDSESKWLKEELPKKYRTDIKFFHYGHEKIQVLLDGYPTLKKHYYGEQVDGCLQDYKSIKRKYMDSISADVKSLQFIGIPTGHYERQNILEKPELAKIYIPLEFLEDRAVSWTQDLKTILVKQNRVVVLGDPGTGKSTLAKYIALIHSQKIASLKDWDLEERVPFIIPIREYVRQQQEWSGTFTFIDYLKYKAENDLYIPKVEKDFFEALLVLGKAIVLFDGLDEIAAESGRHQAAKRIEQFSRQYSDTPVWVTSRIVGYTVNVKLNKEIFKHYYLAPVSEESAEEDIEKFLDYIRDRTGLLVEKGRNEKKENVFAFVHLSFLEYLCAYQLAENKSKSREEHVEALLEYVGISTWAETILLSLYLFSNSTGAESIIDDFCEKMFEVLKREKSETGWYLLGRAVRDNIDFAYDNIKHICREIIGIWLKTQDDKTAFSVLEEIANFSQKGKEFLSEALKEDIEKRPADQAFENFKTRSEFLALNQRDLDSLKSGVFTFRFYDSVSVHFPLNIEFHYMKDTGKKNSPVISSPLLNHEDDINALELTPSYTAQWLDSLRFKGYPVPVEPDEGRWKFKKENTEKMYSDLSLDEDFIRTFILGFGQYFIPGFSEYLVFIENFDLSHVLDLELSIEFSLNLSRNPSQISSLLVAELYKKRYNKLLDWDAMSANIILKLHELYVDELQKDNPELNDALSEYLYDEMPDPLEIEFQLSGGVRQSPSGPKTNSNSFLSSRIAFNDYLSISYAFSFIYTSVLCHHIFTLIAALNTHFRSNGEEITEAIENAVYDYSRRNPLHHYFINFSWEYYSRDFLKAYESDSDAESQSLRLACFMSNAAKVSITAGIPCEGETWQKILQYAESSSHPAVQISLTLYKICNFIESETNESLLWQQLSKFQKDHPDYYSLIGFQSGPIFP